MCKNDQEDIHKDYDGNEIIFLIYALNLFTKNFCNVIFKLKATPNKIVPINVIVGYDFFLQK